MDDTRPTIDDATPSRRFRWRLSLRETVLCASLVVFFLVVYGIAHGPTSGQIRLDTGDMRYCCFGIPIHYERMPEPERSKILKIASMSPSVTREWLTCVTYPLPTSNNPDGVQVLRYKGIAAWADEDPALAKMAMTDHVDSLRRMHDPLWCGGGSILFSVVDLEDAKVEPKWRGDPVIQAYCEGQGYVPLPPAAVSSTR